MKNIFLRNVGQFSSIIFERNEKDGSDAKEWKVFLIFNLGSVVLESSKSKLRNDDWIPIKGKGGFCIIVSECT